MNPYSRLSGVFLRDHPDAAARALENFPAEQVVRFLSESGQAVAGKVIENFTPLYAADCLAVLDPAEAGHLFARLDGDFQLLVLRHVDTAKRDALLQQLPPQLVAAIRRRLPYADGTAGSLMEMPLASVPEDLSVRSAVKRIKRIRRGPKFYIYVTNTLGQLRGVLTLHELINAPPTALLTDVMHRHVVSISPSQPVLTVINSPYWLEYFALPVTDENNTLLGVLRHRSLRRVQEQIVRADAVGEGLQTLAGVGEMFAVTAGHLLSALVAVGSASGRSRD